MKTTPLRAILATTLTLSIAFGTTVVSSTAAVADIASDTLTDVPSLSLTTDGEQSIAKEEEQEDPAPSTPAPGVPAQPEADMPTEPLPHESSSSVPEGSADSIPEIDATTKSRFVPPLNKKGYWVSSYFGPRCPVAVGAGTFHGAVDLAANMGSPLYAMADGKVVSVERTGTPTLRISYGNVDGKELIVSYGHMENPTKYVSVGQKVSRGQRVADVGNAGVSNGPHVHLALFWGGKNLDPLSFFASRGLDLKAAATHAAPKENPSSCQVYVTSKTALKKTADFTGKTLTLLAKDQKLTLYPGPAINGFNKVKTPNGTTGYVLAYRTSTKKAPAEPTPNYGSTAKGVRYKTLGNRHLFSYPGSNMDITGVLDTVPVANIVTTTGRTAGEYTEMTWNGLTGWMPVEYMTKLEDPKPEKPKPSTPSKPQPAQPDKSQASSPKSVQVHRFWSPKFANAHFYTANASEAKSVRAGDKNWTYEGASFRAYLPQNGTCQQGTVGIYRFWSSKFSSHFYTKNPTEMKHLRANDPNWAFEGLVFCEPTTAAGTAPVYRFWSPKYQKHFFTANAAEMRSIRKGDPSWTYEGVAWYAPKK